MKKKTFIITSFCCIVCTLTIIFCLFLFLGNKQSNTPVKVKKEEKKEKETDTKLSATVKSDTVEDENSIDESAPEDNFNIWIQVPDVFSFCSGVGSWATTITIGDDGSFTGTYHDSNMGEIGPGYPNGTVYLCNFTGKFTTPTKVTDTVYSMKLESMSLERPEGQEYIEDEIKYITTGPYGLENSNVLYLYLPGTPRANLSEGFLSWIHYDVYDALPAGLYGIYNIQDDTGFESYQQTGQ